MDILNGLTSGDIKYWGRTVIHLKIITKLFFSKLSQTPLLTCESRQ